MKVLIKNGQTSTLLNLPEADPIENAEIQLSVDLEAMTVVCIVEADGTTYTAEAELEE